MYRIFLVMCVGVFIASACNDGNSKTNKEKKSATATSDSYSTDTLYQALPQLLQDLSSSENMKDLLAQNWVLEDDKDALEHATDDGSIEMPVRSLSMAVDNTIIKNCRNALDKGTWLFNNDKKTITFHYTDGSTDLYKIRSLAADELKLTNIGIKSETVLKFVSDAKRYINKSDDPFYFVNNLWRIKPAAPETDIAIKQRLKNNVHFFILAYKDAIARKSSVVSFYGFPSCLKWYAGGIYLQNKTELSQKWIDCFYNKAQALKAYALMDEVLSKKYNWPTSNANWIKKNLFVLEQMYLNL